MSDLPHDIRLLHDRRIPMQDGFRLSADVYLPQGSGPFPAIVTRTPYESGRDVFIDLGVWWSEHGYAFVVQDCRGRFESEGTFHAYFPDIEDGRTRWNGSPVSRGATERSGPGDAATAP